MREGERSEKVGSRERRSVSEAITTRDLRVDEKKVRANRRVWRFQGGERTGVIKRREKEER